MKLLRYFLLGCLLFGSELSAQVTFRLQQLPAYTPANANLYVAGTFNNWNPGSSSHQLSRLPDSSYAITLPAATGSISFKFTRGSWASVEGNASGGPRPNHTYTFGSQPDTVNIQILSWEDLHGGGGGTSTANAQVQLLTDSFWMPQLNRFRRISLYLPPNYAGDTSRRYRVLYMHDGQNLFDNLRAFAGEWEVDETLSRLHQEGDAGAIVVAIDNGGAQRLNEYSPWVNAQYGGGQGAAYVDFIVQTLKPYIDLHYRTDSSRQATAIWGSSMGGLISQYAAMKYQEVFGKVGVFSPSLWFSSQIFTQIGLEGRRQSMRFYILAGALESSTLVSQATQLKNELLDAGFLADEVNLQIKADGQHSEWFWRREFAAAYQWLFGQSSALTPEAWGQLQAYPNPAREQLRLQWEGGTDSAIYQWVDMQGRVQQWGHVQRGDTLDTRQLARGMYQLWISSGAEVLRTKVVLH